MSTFVNDLYMYMYFVHVYTYVFKLVRNMIKWRRAHFVLYMYCIQLHIFIDRKPYGFANSKTTHQFCLFSTWTTRLNNPSDLLRVTSLYIGLPHKGNFKPRAIIVSRLAQSGEGLNMSLKVVNSTFTVGKNFFFFFCLLCVSRSSTEPVLMKLGITLIPCNMSTKRNMLLTKTSA